MTAPMNQSLAAPCRRQLQQETLDERRLDSYRKLRREEMYNTETVAERHARTRQFSKDGEAAPGNLAQEAGLNGAAKFLRASSR